MKAHDLAWTAVRALKEAQAATAEVVRLRHLLEEAQKDLELAIQDGTQPRYIQVMNPPCTMASNGRCHCKRCNEWRTYTEWFNHAAEGYYAMNERRYILEKQLEEAQQMERQAAQKAKHLAKEARNAALAQDE